MIRALPTVLLIALVLAACGKDAANNTSTNNMTSSMPNATPNGTPNNQMPNNQMPNNQMPNNQMPNNMTTNTNQMTNTGMPLACNAEFAMADACGGNPVGTWELDEICSNFDFGAAVTTLCPNAVIVGGPTFDGTGTLEVTADSFSQTVQGTATLSVDLPNGCEFMDCGLAVGSLETVVDEAACNDLGADGCACTVSVAIEEMTQGAYTVTNGTATLGTGETYLFCVGGPTILIRETGGAATYLYSSQ